MLLMVVSNHGSHFESDVDGCFIFSFRYAKMVSPRFRSAYGGAASRVVSTRRVTIDFAHGADGSGKTLAAFMNALDRLLFRPRQDVKGVRVLYISPLKALGVDVERNLQAPLVGLTALAKSEGVEYSPVKIGVRSGDTSTRERAQQVRNPPDILITTPESLFLLLTSKARESLKAVDTVIIDEIHAMAGTKRGAHLFLSLERLEFLRTQGRPLQRIGLSATQRPLSLIAALLGGSAWKDEKLSERSVSIIDVAQKKTLELSIEMPDEFDSPQNGATDGDENDDFSDDEVLDFDLMEPVDAPPKKNDGFWPFIHARILELIKEHRTTLIFVNARRSSERLAVP